MAYTLFLDESGELGFGANCSEFMVITVLSTAYPKYLKNRMKKAKKKLYDKGWPRDIEIKGTELNRSHKNSRIPSDISNNKDSYLREMMEKIVQSDVKVHYSAIRKNDIIGGLRSAPYGIAYNFFAGTLLVRSYGHFAGPLHMIIDQRNKETHDKMTFNAYVHTKLIEVCDHAESLQIDHKESHAVIGLQAVDFISWGLFRYFEHDDPQYKNIIDQAVGYRDHWYARK